MCCVTSRKLAVARRIVVTYDVLSREEYSRIVLAIVEDGSNGSSPKHAIGCRRDQFLGVKISVAVPKGRL